MADQLKLQVLFSAIDKLTAPIERMRRGSKGLASDIAATRREIKDLGQAQKLVGAFKLQDAGLKKRTADLEAARAATAKYRAELAATDAPTIRMRKNLEQAEKREAALTRQHEEQSKALADLSTRLKTAGVDTAKLGDHEAALASKLGAANNQLEQQQARAAKLGAARARGEKLQSLGNNTALTGGAMTAGISLPLMALAKSSMDASIESADALGQVKASMASMGNAAQRTLPQLQAQAKGLQHISTFDDDEILRKVTTSMLTFDKVSGPIFDRAQLAAVNLSAKFGKDLQSSSIMVGKALQDPLKGLTALTKIGVSFNDQQQAQIKAMVKAGDIAGAQAIIMGELERQTNGAAKAARDAKPGQDAVESWNDFKETVGAVVVNVLPPLTAALKTVLDGFNTLSPGTQKFLVIAALIIAVLGPVLTIFGTLISIIGGVAAALSIGFLPAIGVILAVVAAVGALGYAAYQIYQNWDGIKAYFSGLWTGIKQAFHTGIEAIKSAMTTALGWFKTIGRMMMDGLLIALNPALLAGKLIEIAKKGITAFKNFFGIKSPSRLMMEMGGHMTRGLAIGVDRGGGHALKSMGRLATGMAAGAALGLSAPALAGGGAQGGGAAGPASQVVYNVTIQIQGADAGDPRQAALAIKRELDALLAIDARGSYQDG